MSEPSTVSLPIFLFPAWFWLSGRASKKRFPHSFSLRMRFLDKYGSKSSRPFANSHIPRPRPTWKDGMGSYSHPPELQKRFHESLDIKIHTSKHQKGSKMWHSPGWWLHFFLGRFFSSNLKTRGNPTHNWRASAASAAWSTYRHFLPNSNVSHQSFGSLPPEKMWHGLKIWGGPPQLVNFCWIKCCGAHRVLRCFLCLKKSQLDVLI